MIKKAFSTTSPLNRLSDFWRDIPLARKGIVITLLPLLLLLGSLSFLYSKEIHLSQLESQLRIALQNQRDIQAVHTQLLEASNGIRDFLLTDDAHFLDNFYLAQKQLPPIMAQLEQKLETNAQKERLFHIEPLVEKNLEYLSILAQSQTSTDPELLNVQFKMQVDSLDQLRMEIEQLNKQEAFLVFQDQKNVALQRERNFKVTLFTALIGIIGSVITLWFFLDTIVNRVRALRDSARHLAKAEPLDLAFSSADELGELSDELDHASQLLANKIEEAHLATFEAKEANHAKTLFLSRTSHELRTPLNAILGFAQLLEADLKDSTHRNNATMIKRAGDHLLTLINDVLDIASIESGERNLTLQSTDVNQVIAEAVDYLSPLAHKRQMQISQHVAKHLHAYADPQKLLQVILNLLSNALKYGPFSSTVSVEAYKQTNKVVIEVLDEGPGIPEDLKKRLFSPFDRLGAEQTNVEGSGLGLALSKQIMTALNGTLTAEKAKSLFRITLPVDNQNIPSHKLPSGSIETPLIKSKQSTGGAHHVLYVEDNDSNRTLVEAILQREKNIKLSHCTTLQSAKSMLENNHIALIILDLHLPDGSGEQLISHLRSTQTSHHTPILVLSADAMPETIARVEKAGVQDYLTKPLDVAAFSATVRKLLPSKPIDRKGT